MMEDYFSKPSYPAAPQWDLRDPDREPSRSGMAAEDHEGMLHWVFKVKGLGVIVLRATSSYKNDDGKMAFKGMSTFTNTEVGFWE